MHQEGEHENKQVILEPALDYSEGKFEGQINYIPQMTKTIQKKKAKIYKCDRENPQVSRFTINIEDQKDIKQIFNNNLQQQYGQVFYRTRSRSRLQIQPENTKTEDLKNFHSETDEDQMPSAKGKQQKRILLSYSAKKRQKRVLNDFSQYDVHWVRKRPKTKMQFVRFQPQENDNLQTQKNQSNKQKISNITALSQIELPQTNQQQKIQYNEIYQGKCTPLVQQQTGSNSGDYSSTLHNLQQEFEAFLSENDQNEAQEGYEIQIRTQNSTIDILTQELAIYKQKAENMKSFIVSMQNQMSTISLPRQNDCQYDIITWMASQKAGFRYNNQKLQQEIINNPQFFVQYSQLIKCPDQKVITLDQVDYLEKVYRDLKARIECRTPNKWSIKQSTQKTTSEESPLSSK